MIELIVDEIRDFLRTDAANDTVITPFLNTSIAYVSSAVGAENALTADPRCISAVSLKCYDYFYATDVFEAAITAIISQIRADPYIPPVTV